MSGSVRPNGLIIAIDGPSGAGKSTITRLLSKRLDYLYIDTGAMYRVVALAVQRSGISTEDDTALTALCRSIDIAFARTDGCCQVFLNGEDVTDAIRTPEISLLTSKISSRKVVRDILAGMQRELGKDGGVVLEGRDIGTVVFPDADVKFFLSATAEERGTRRFLELQAKGENICLERTIAEVAQRDDQDARREHAPLRRADDAIEIDSTRLSIEDVIDFMMVTINKTVKGEK
jgi:cytidylate kinase